jgi:hypothetical protein
LGSWVSPCSPTLAFTSFTASSEEELSIRGEDRETMKKKSLTLVESKARRVHSRRGLALFVFKKWMLKFLRFFWRLFSQLHESLQRFFSFLSVCFFLNCHSLGFLIKALHYLFFSIVVISNLNFLNFPL